MASGLRAASKHSSARSLGSFVELGSASSSEFEPVDLEVEDMTSQADSSYSNQQSFPGAVVGKNTTPPSSITPPLKTVPEQSEIRPSPERSGDGTASAYVEPLQEGLQNLENATQKAAEMAKEFTNKLLTSSAAEARSSVMRLAGDVSSWWAALDPVPKPQEPPQNTARSAQGNEEVQGLFGLPEDEELMERFSCSLLQSMECNHNSFSKARQVSCPGQLYVTSRNACFSAEGVRFAIPHRDVRQTAKEQDGTKTLRLDFISSQGERNHVLFEGFRGSELDSALALLEHVTEC